MATRVPNTLANINTLADVRDRSTEIYEGILAKSKGSRLEQIEQRLRNEEHSQKLINENLENVRQNRQVLSGDFLGSIGMDRSLALDADNKKRLTLEHLQKQKDSIDRRLTSTKERRESAIADPSIQQRAERATGDYIYRSTTREAFAQDVIRGSRDRNYINEGQQIASTMSPADIHRQLTEKYEQADTLRSKIRDTIPNARYGPQSDNAPKMEGLLKELAQLSDAAKALQAASHHLEKVADSAGGGGRFNSILNGVSTIAGAAGKAVDIAGYGFIDSRIQEIQAKTGMANTQNKRFDYMQAAAQGDVAAMRQLNNWDSNVGFANRMGTLKQGQSLTKATATLLSSGADATLAGIDLFNRAGTAGFTSLFTGDEASKTATAVNQITDATGSAVYAGVDAYRGLSRSATTIAGFNAMEGMTAAVYHPMNVLQQNARNKMLASYDATQGAGSQSEQMIPEMMTGNTAYYAASIGQERLRGLYGFGTQNMGTAFTKADNRESMIQRAVDVDKSRVMSGEQYMGSLNRFTSLGATGQSAQGSMEVVLASAVQRGVESAKNISEMVDSISSLAQSSGRGLDVSGAAAAAVAGGMGRLGGSGLSEVEKLNIVSSGANTIKNIQEHRGLDLPTLAGMSAGMNAGVKGSPYAVLNATTQNQSTVQTLVDDFTKDPMGLGDRTKSQAMQYGWYDTVYDNEGKLKVKDPSKTISDAYNSVTRAKFLASKGVPAAPGSYEEKDRAIRDIQELPNDTNGLEWLTKHPYHRRLLETAGNDVLGQFSNLIGVGVRPNLVTERATLPAGGAVTNSLFENQQAQGVGMLNQLGAVGGISGTLSAIQGQTFDATKMGTTEQWQGAISAPQQAVSDNQLLSSKDVEALSSGFSNFSLATSKLLDKFTGTEVSDAITKGVAEGLRTSNISVNAGGIGAQAPASGSVGSPEPAKKIGQSP